MSNAASKSGDELHDALASAAVDDRPETDDERAAIAKKHPFWVDGAEVTAMIAERLRRG